MQASMKQTVQANWVLVGHAENFFQMTIYMTTFELVYITLLKADQIYIDYLVSPLLCPNLGKYYYLSGEFFNFWADYQWN